LTGLTEKQKKVLAVITEGAQSGLPPTVREICRAAGIKSTSSVHQYLKVLEDAGYITRQSGLTRAIRIPGDDIMRVPLMGRVTAGMPILAVENTEEYIAYTGNYHISELFALRIVGESMINAGIMDGDIVIVHQDSAISNGDIVVALLGDEATVKRFYREADGVRLQPENDNYEPIYAKEVSVLGRVVSLIRDLD